MAIDYSTRLQQENKQRGYDWLVSEFARLRDSVRAEATRLLGPDRGE